MQILEFLQNVCITEISFVNTFIAGADYYPVHNKGRQHHGLMLTLENTETYYFRDSVIEALPGSVLYIPKGEEYRITLAGNKSVMSVVDFELSGSCSRPFLTVFSEFGSVKGCFSKTEAEWNRKEASYLPECKSLCYRIIGMMARQASEYHPSRKFEKIRAAEAYMHQNYMKNDFRLDKLAEISGISQRYFEMLFQQKYGTPPKEYVLSLKIQQAKELLMSEKLLVRDVALMLGYSDIYHFGKIFAKKTGYTPSEYRNSLLIK